MSDTSKTAKIRKRWYHSPSHRPTVNLLLHNITFLWFLMFSMCHSLHVAVNSVYADVLYIYICCFITITKFLCWWSIINHLLSTAMKTPNLKYFGVKILIFRGHILTSSEREHQTQREIFPSGGQWWPCVYLARIRRYGASKILGSRV